MSLEDYSRGKRGGARVKGVFKERTKQECSTCQRTVFNLKRHMIDVHKIGATGEVKKTSVGRSKWVVAQAQQESSSDDDEEINNVIVHPHAKKIAANKKSAPGPKAKAAAAAATAANVTKPDTTAAPASSTSNNVVQFLSNLLPSKKAEKVSNKPDVDSEDEALAGKQQCHLCEKWYFRVHRHLRDVHQLQAGFKKDPN